MRHRNAVRVRKVIAIDVVNEVRRLCFGGALLSALVLEKNVFRENFFWKNRKSSRVVTLRVGSSSLKKVTLRVKHFPRKEHYQSYSKFWLKGAATFCRQANFEATNVQNQYIR